MEIEGVGPEHARRLEKAGVTATDGGMVGLLGSRKARKLAGGVPKLADVAQCHHDLHTPVFARAK